MITDKLIKNGSDILKRYKISSHLLDSEIILSNIMNEERMNFITAEKKKIPKSKVKSFFNLIDRRTRSEPIAYIIKQKSFWKRDFIVDKNTLIPRPETELMVEKIKNHFKKSSLFILDVGTGSGCILISLLEELPRAKGIGIDISKKALNIAKKNAKFSTAKSRIKFINKTINSHFLTKFDLVVSNPPYICSHQIKNLPLDIKNFEPKIALDGGNDGLDVIKKVIYKARNILKFKGMLALEIGNGQYKKVSQLLRINKFRKNFLIKDYRNNIRCVLATLEN